MHTDGYKTCAIGITTEDENNDGEIEKKRKQYAEVTIHASSFILHLPVIHYSSRSTVHLGLDTNPFPKPK